MSKIIDALNSPFGLLIAGAVISGLLVQYITSGWQQRNWIFQQTFTARKAQFEKRLERQYKILDDLNSDIAAVFANSQFVVAAHIKRVPKAQFGQIIASYNDAVMKWELAFPLHSIHLKSQFPSTELAKLLLTLKQKRDELDVAIYELTESQGASSERCIALSDQLSNAMSVLSQKMLAEINAAEK